MLLLYDEAYFWIAKVTANRHRDIQLQKNWCFVIVGPSCPAFPYYNTRSQSVFQTSI